DELLDRLEERPRPADVVEEFTLPLPVAVISRLMGLDGSSWDRMRHWSEHAFSDGSHAGEEVESVLKEF
ncbi:cytochrome P450, partial [Streptomyces cavourensis]|nr:cytochrome P450 [Streptomyces cavourensis]